jgi:hypothetical protein
MTQTPTGLDVQVALVAVDLAHQMRVVLALQVKVLLAVLAQRALLVAAVVVLVRWGILTGKVLAVMVSPTV